MHNWHMALKVLAHRSLPGSYIRYNRYNIYKRGECRGILRESENRYDEGTVGKRERKNAYCTVAGIKRLSLSITTAITWLGTSNLMFLISFPPRSLASAQCSG